ncbi:NUDIX domain-containing protein [Alkalicoccobacillus murimartini]|nr:NUDIX hydrolase [Alkalicoccobacillus murimartini]
MMKRVDVASAIICDEYGRMLLVKNRKGTVTYWTPPGGAVEAGETLEEAAIREVFEETGFHVNIGRIHSVREKLFHEMNEHAMIFSFYATITGGMMQNNDPDEDIVDIQWVEHVSAKEWMPELYASLQLHEINESKSAFYQFEKE